MRLRKVIRGYDQDNAERDSKNDDVFSRELLRTDGRYGDGYHVSLKEFINIHIRI